jgi:hypothetical protein
MWVAQRSIRTSGVRLKRSLITFVFESLQVLAWRQSTLEGAV